MLSTRWIRIALVSFLLVATAAWAQAPSQTPAEWKPVEDALQRNGSIQPGDVFKVGMPRSDLHVTVNGAAVQPGLALGSWVAFKKMGDKAMVMGDMVLAASEVPQVMTKLENSGIFITALHNHLIGESPRVMYMHIMGQGDAATLAKSIHDAVAATGTPPAAKPDANAKPDLDTAAIEQALGRKGKASGTILQFSVPRAEKVTDDGIEVPAAMGTATAINFQGTGGGRALTTGDFVLIASEVNPVIQALTSNGIQVTAVHNHMLNDQPHLFFLHFWGNDQATKLAQGLRAALDKVNTAKP